MDTDAQTSENVLDNTNIRCKITIDTHAHILKLYSRQGTLVNDTAAIYQPYEIIHSCHQNIIFEIFRLILSLPLTT